MKVEKTNLKKEQAAETKKKLYKSAESLFIKKDFNDVTVDSIVEAAGVSKGTFYVHFNSKDALIASFISDYVTNIDLDYKTFLESLPSNIDSSSTLILLIEKITDVLKDKIGYEIMSTVYKIQLTRSVNMDAVKGYNRELYKLFEEILQYGIVKGEFKSSIHIDQLTKHFVMAIRGLSHEWCIRYPEFDLKKESIEHFKILLEGIKS